LNTQKIYRYRKRIKAWHCKKCNNSFSPLSGTIFEKSRTDMRKWLYTIYLVINTGKSAIDLRKEIHVTYKTAWRILKLVREEMGNEEMKKAFRYFLGRGIQDEFELVPGDKTVGLAQRSLLRKH
jgi:transposase-like protein